MRKLYQARNQNNTGCFMIEMIFQDEASNANGAPHSEAMTNRKGMSSRGVSSFGTPWRSVVSVVFLGRAEGKGAAIRKSWKICQLNVLLVSAIRGVIRTIHNDLDGKSGNHGDLLSARFCNRNVRHRRVMGILDF
jgi:hypothetical protein